MPKNGARKSLSIVACLACYSSCHGAPAQQDVRGTATIVALELHDNLAPVLIAQFSGMEVPLQFDLGSSNALVLQKSVLETIGAVPTGESITQQDVRGVFEVPTYGVPRVQIGDVVFTNVRALMDVPRVGREPARFARGYLGTGLLKSYAVVLDYEHRRITLLRGEGTAFQELCRGVAVSFSMSSPLWRGEAVTESDTDVGRVTLWWDTGAPSTALQNAASYATNLPASTKQLVTHQFTLGDNNYGPWIFDIWKMSLPGFDGFIGDDFFKRHRVCIDYPDNRVVIGP